MKNPVEYFDGILILFLYYHGALSPFLFVPLSFDLGIFTICNLLILQQAFQLFIFLKFQGFIRNEVFDPRNWRIPGSSPRSHSLDEQVLSSESKIYVRGNRKLKLKTVADVVEALVGAYVSTGGETAGLLFMDWIGMKVDFMTISYDRHFLVQPEKYVNVHRLESILKYSFKDTSLLLEALTHGSYMIADIPRCYQVNLIAIVKLICDYVIDGKYHLNLISFC